MIVRRIAIGALVLGALGLAGCAPSAPGSSGHPSTPSATTPGTATPSASPTPATPATPAVRIPTDCHAIVTPQEYATIFGQTPLNDPAVVGTDGVGAVTPTIPPPGATNQEILSSATQLRCVWRYPEADITYLEATIATVDPAVATKYLGELATTGYTCKDAHGGRQCQLVKRNDQYPVDEGYTAFSRDAVYIYVGQANFRTNDLIGKLVTTIWG